MFTKAVVWLCLGVLLFHSSWASGSVEKLLEGVQADILEKISCAAKIPVLWKIKKFLSGGNKEKPNNFQSFTLILQMTTG